MPAKLERTRTPGIFKRGSKYVIAYRDAGGNQRRESAPTYDAARRLKADRLSERNKGKGLDPSSTPTPFDAYALEWINRYRGRKGGRGFRESTRDNYRGDLQRHAVPFFGARPLASITPRDLDRFVDELLKDPRGFSDSTIANIVKPVRACLKTARAEGLIPTDPSAEVVLPSRARIIEDDDENADVRAFTRDQLAAVLSIVHPKHRVLLELLATTGLRISEALALEWRHLDLELAPRVRVRQQVYRGRLGPPKTAKGRRDVPIPPGLAARLRERRRGAEWNRDTDLVFANEAGKVHHVENLRKRHLRHALSESGVSGASFHTFRHTFASLKLEAGAKIPEVAALLGHSSPRVTLDVYSHWIGSDDPTPLDLDAELGAQGGNRVVTQATSTGRNAVAA